MNNLKFYVAAICLFLCFQYGFAQIEDDYASYDDEWENFIIDDGFSPNTAKKVLYTAFLVVAVVGLLANTVVFFVIFCGNEIGKC